MSLKIRIIIKLSCVVGLLCILAGCGGILGGTKVLQIHIDSPPHNFLKTVEVRSIELDENATRLDSVGVYKVGEFSAKDLNNLTASLQNSLIVLQSAQPSISGQKILLYMIIRRYMVIASNNAGGVLSTIAWCAVDETGDIIYHEQFYASQSARLIKTLGSMKNEVNEGILRRIVEVSAYLASNNEPTRPLPPMPMNTYIEFNQAKGKLPRSFQSYYSYIYVGGGYIYNIIGISSKVNAEWEWAEQADHINWPEYIRSKGGARGGS